MKNLLIFPLFLSLISIPAFSKEYTPSQLFKMVNSGKFPEQIDGTTTYSSVPFATCAANAEKIARSVEENYPVKRIIQTSSIVTYKFWANDGVTVVTCTSDNRMGLTKSSYK